MLFQRGQPSASCAAVSAAPRTLFQSHHGTGSCVSCSSIAFACRVVWSRSLHATADMFSLLKSDRPEPDATTAAAVGLDDAADDGSKVGNPVARDMLLRMPGVTETNVSALMEAAGSLQGLADLEVAEVQAAVGPQAGRALYDFLHMPCPVAG